MIAADAFDFSGRYVFIATSVLMHRLDESIRPLLEERGGRISRIYTDMTPRPATGDFSPAALPPGFFEKEHVRAVFTTDHSAPPNLVPLSIPLFAFSHAFWFPRPHTEQMLQICPSYVGNADYYLTQDDAAVSLAASPYMPHKCKKHATTPPPTQTPPLTHFSPASHQDAVGSYSILYRSGISNLMISGGAGLRNHTRPRFCTPAVTARMAFRSSWRNAKPSLMRA